MGPSSTSVIQVTNIAPTVTNEQLRTLFAFIGTIREFIVYPLDSSQQICRVGYVRFLDPMSVPVAQHLTNTVFIDRAIFVKPVSDGKIPDESMALKLANEGHSQNSSNSGVVSQVATVNGVQSITTIDPRLNALGLPQYPPLPANLDPSKIEEIRRTISVTNIAKLSTPEDLLEFFNQFGEVKYLRMTSSETDIIKSSLIEFTDQSSVANALQNCGINLHGNQLNILHANTNILKPQYKNDGDKPLESRDLKRRSRSRSKSYHRSRSPARKSRRSRSPRRSKERRRSPSGSRSPPRRRRSRSRRRSADRRRSRSRSYSKESRSRDRSRRDRSRDRYHRESRERSMERRRSYEHDRDKDRRRHERSKERRSRDHDRARSKERERRRDRDRSRERDSSRKDRHRSRKDKDRHRSKSRSTSKLRYPLERRDRELEAPIKDKDLIDNGEADRALEAENLSVKSGHSSSQKSASPQVFSDNSKTKTSEKDDSEDEQCQF